MSKKDLKALTVPDLAEIRSAFCHTLVLKATDS